MKVNPLFPGFLLFFLASCSSTPGVKDDTQVVAEDPEKVNTLITDFLSSHLKSADTAKAFHLGADSMIAMPQLVSFYAARNFKAAWSEKGKLNPAGDSMLAIVRDAESFGLIPEDYHVTALDSLVETAYDSIKESYNVNKLATTDMLLTDAFFTFAVHVSVGRMANDSATAREWRIRKVNTDLVATLNEALSQKPLRKTFEDLEPQRLEYQAVKRYMNEYRRKMKHITWDHLPDRKKDSTGFFAAIKDRLTLFGDLDTNSAEKDSIRISEALKKFQKRYFLEPDGKLGRNTILALDMTPTDWTRQLAMNMERWRWEPAKFEKRHMIVNLPAFKMTVWEEDTIVMESRIVCGAVKTQTPELDSKMYQIVLYPFWNVPYSISWKEILPHVQRDSSYLRKNHYEVLDRNNQLVDPSTVKWKKYGRGNLPYKFRQMYGDDNALGIMKFEFNNKYGVYMHDTNAKKYFHFETRAFSHGCMRLEKYMELAHFLIRDDSIKLPKDTFDVWTTTGDQRRVNLRKPLPIHVRYFTAVTDTEGNVNLHCDIYLRDRRMEKVLYKDFAPLQEMPVKTAWFIFRKKESPQEKSKDKSSDPAEKQDFVPRRYRYSNIC